MADLTCACCWGMLLACALASPAPAESLRAELREAESLEEALLSDAADGQLDQHDFLSAALIAGGVQGRGELADWQGRYESFAQPEFLPTDGTLQQRLEAIQEHLHARVLIGKYRAEASDLRIAIGRGDYNCLSALALHYDLSLRAGLSLEICAQPGHVHLRLGEGQEIEPGLRERRGVPLNRRPARSLTPVELLGKFYYNRGVEQLRSGQYAAGLALLETSLQLDPADRDARENLLAGLNNWAVEHCRRDRFDLAAPLIEQGLAIEPTFAPLVANEQLVRKQAAFK